MHAHALQPPHLLPRSRPFFAGRRGTPSSAAGTACACACAACCPAACRPDRQVAAAGRRPRPAAAGPRDSMPAHQHHRQRPLRPQQAAGGASSRRRAPGSARPPRARHRQPERPRGIAPRPPGLSAGRHAAAQLRLSSAAAEQGSRALTRAAAAQSASRPAAGARLPPAPVLRRTAGGTPHKTPPPPLRQQMRHADACAPCGGRQAGGGRQGVPGGARGGRPAPCSGGGRASTSRPRGTAQPPTPARNTQTAAPPRQGLHEGVRLTARRSRRPASAGRGGG